jgi:NTE family protein
MASGKLALVLSGGGMGGAAHLGAIKALEEYGLKPDAVLGTSIGAYVGSVYASGATPDMMIEGWQKISQMDPSDVLDLDLNSLRHAFTQFDYRRVTGFLLGRVLMSMLTDNYVHIRSFPELARLSPEERKAKNIKAFYACATNLLDGRETIFCDSRGIPLDADGLYEDRRLCHHVSFVDAVRASFSLPAIFVPHKIPFTDPADPCVCMIGANSHGPQYHLYVDGSIKDDFPITIAAKLAKADKIIGLNLTKAGSKASLVLKGGLPEIQDRIVKIVGNDQYEADRYDKDVAKVDLITIDPAIGEVGVFDLSMGDWLIERGYEAVKQCFTEKGLDPALSQEENLNRLFLPLLVEDCPECGQRLSTPLDLGTNEHFIAALPPYKTPETNNATPHKRPIGRRLASLSRLGWLFALIGLFLLFIVGGFQFWWVYQLAERQGQGGVVFVGGGLIYIATVLVGSMLIGSWLVNLLKGFIRRLQLRETNP